MEISDGSNWYTVLNWGMVPLIRVQIFLFRYAPPPNPTDCTGEPDNCIIDRILFCVMAQASTIDLDSDVQLYQLDTYSVYPHSVNLRTLDDDGIGIDGLQALP